MRRKLYKMGDTRIKRRFLFFPKRIGKDERWLEFATWEEEYFYSSSLGYGGWFVEKWINKDDN